MVEAYVVDNMSTDMILGNDYADQYGISILRKDEGTVLEFGSSGRSVNIENSMQPMIDESIGSFYVEVSALKAKATIKKVKTQRNRKLHKFNEGQTMRILQSTTLEPNISKRIEVRLPWKEQMSEGFIEPTNGATQLQNCSIVEALVVTDISHKGRVSVIGDSYSLKSSSSIGRRSA